jgi:hypothetical protein
MNKIKAIFSCSMGQQPWIKGAIGYMVLNGQGNLLQYKLSPSNNPRNFKYD